MSSEIINQVGSWYDCINPLSLPLHAHFFQVGTLNYTQKICPMCWNKLLELQHYKNGGFRIDTHKKSNDCKPEKDSL